MALKKKLAGFSSLLLLLLFSPLLENLSLASSYTDYFNFSGDDLINLYDIFMDNSLGDLNTYDTSYSGNIETLWNSGENLLKNEFTIEELNVIADNLNYFMYDCWILSGDGYGWNSEFQTTWMKDSYLWVSVAPGQQVNSVSGRNIVFAFTPQANVALYLDETTSAGSSSYIVSKKFYNYAISGDGTITQENWQTSFTIILEIKPDKTVSTYYRKNSTSYQKYPFNEFYRRGLMYPYINDTFYYNGMLSTFRINKYWAINDFYVRTPLTNNMYRQADLGFYYNLDTKEASSGETPAPTPTPGPTSTPGSGEGGTADLTETNGLISGVIDSLTTSYDPIASGESVSSGEIIEALGFTPMADPYDNFWTTFLTGLKNSLLNSNRTIPLSFFNNTYYLRCDDIAPRYSLEVSSFLSVASTTFMFLGMIKFWHFISHRLQSGDIDDVLLEAQEDGIISLF